MAASTINIVTVHQDSGKTMFVALIETDTQTSICGTDPTLPGALEALATKLRNQRIKSTR